MIQLAVYTYYEYDRPTWAGFSSLEDLRDFVSLSVLHSKRYIGKTKLVCNKKGKELLADCGFDIIDTSLENLVFDKQLWAYPKLHTYSIQTTPFIHIDLDALLWEKPPLSFLNASACFQHKELFSIHRDYTSVLNKYKNHGVRVKLNDIDYAYCCGFAGGNDLSFFKKWKALADLYIKTTRISLMGYGWQNHFTEQFFAASTAYECGISDKVQFLCGQEVYSPKSILPFAHLWGGSKRKREHIDKCLSKSKLVSHIEQMPKYFLTYPLTERVNNVQQNIKENQFTHTHIIDGVTPEQADSTTEMLGVEIKKDISLGNKCAFLAHRRLWSICKENKWSMAVEDDAFFKLGWHTYLRKVPTHIFQINTPVVIKLCVFNPDTGSSEYPPADAKKVSDGLYKISKGLSAVCYIANKAYFELMWDKCNVINGKTQDETTQAYYNQVSVFGFFPNIVVNRAEIKSIRGKHNRSELGGWSISEDMLDYLYSLPKGAKMVELGSGIGTKYLLKHFNLTSIEQNEAYVNKYHSNYIHAPIANGWFDINALIGKDLTCDVLLVDAPFGVSRAPIIDYFYLFNADTVVFDDVNRDKDMDVAVSFCKKHGFTYTIHGTDKLFAVCTRNKPTV